MPPSAFGTSLCERREGIRVCEFSEKLNRLYNDYNTAFTATANDIVGRPNKRESVLSSLNNAPCDAPTSHDANPSARPSGKSACLSAFA